MEVPKDWLQHREHAREAKAKLLKQLGDDDNVFSIGLVGQETKFGKKKGLKIRVQVQDKLSTASVPTATDDIPVTTEAAPTNHGPAGCHNSSDESSAGGGELVGWTNGGWGTATCAVVHDPGGSEEDRLLHCAHVFWDDCNDAKNGDITGRGAHRGRNNGGTKIGEVSTYDRKGDYVLIEERNGGSFMSYIDDNNDYPSVGGRVSETKIDSMATSSGEDVYNMGVTTGLTTGQIVSSDKSFTFTCMNFHDEGVESTTNFANGDSGSPCYVLRDGDAYITHVGSYRYYDRDGIKTCSGDTAQQGNAVGTAGYYIQNNENISFD
ncbi:hypothetical protein [Haloferax gibbonsii]|nr:hypothetical protein [Haloferax gibbonsii]